MKPEFSPLKFHNFIILESNLAYEPISNLSKAEIIPEDLPIELDYAIHQEDGSIQVFVTVAINYPITKEGYSIYTEAVGIFGQDKKLKLSHNDWNQLIGSSAVGIMISNVRVFIQNLTSYGPLGPYILPSIDLGQLLKLKAKEVLG